METRNERASYYAAMKDFQRARRRAQFEQVMARLTGKSANLFSYDDVRQKLRVKQRPSTRELKEIPLDAIVGSVGRYNDFTRRFLPKRSADQERWAKVRTVATDAQGWPPIEVYQVGDTYFVIDGHHRVSVARQFDSSHIEAYVTQVSTKVPLSPEDQPEDLILKAEYTGFLERTHLDETCPDVDLTLTALGQYQVLEEHVAVHRYFMGIEQQREIPYEAAAAHWCREVYRPVVQVIEDHELLRAFPKRTAADLYIWISEHRAELTRELHWEVGFGAAAADLAVQANTTQQQVLARLADRMLDALVPENLDTGPAPGTWYRERVAPRRDDRLFVDLLVAVDGGEGGRRAQAQALHVAQRDGARVLGMHVVPTEEERQSPAVAEMQAEFEGRCADAGVEGRLIVVVGKVSRVLCEWARWNDLVVISLAHPPHSRPLARLGSNLVTTLQRCPRPVLAVPAEASPTQRLLLAYDGTPKAEEALFVATYLTARWSLALTVLTVPEKGLATPDTLDRARAYLESRDVSAALITREGLVAETILGTAADHGSDLIVIGGYGHSPLVSAVLGSTVDQLLRSTDVPVLICR
jgi:nucleotide-binding universal stress UspA family protein